MKKPKYIFFLILCFGFFLPTKAQNLVPNPSFEDTVSCPDNAGQIDRTIGWNSPTQYGTPDYFNNCSSICNTNNIIGSQLPHSGNAYTGIATFGWNGSNYESGIEYLQNKLIDSLELGKTYIVEFYVSLADSVVYNCNNIGVYFSTDSTYNTTNILLPLSPQISNDISNSLSSKNNWTLVSGSFTAGGGEKYLIIGNFTPMSSIDTSYVGNGNAALAKAYYYVDDISVILDTTTSIHENTIDYYYFNLYPNPNPGTMTLNYQLNANETGEMILYDVTGKKISRYVLKNNNNQLNISEQLNDGIYFYQVIVNGIPLKTDKLIIEK